MGKCYAFNSFMQNNVKTLKILVRIITEGKNFIFKAINNKPGTFALQKNKSKKNTP